MRTSKECDNQVRRGPTAQKNYKMTRIAKDDAFEVSDSTDWLETPLRSVAPIDAALRCQVCKDFYNTPMITSCAHTFCSTCIRRCLSNDGKCPACRATDQEMKLRNNWVLEELVDAFQKARLDILEYARKSETEVTEMSIKRKRAEAAEVEEESPRKRTRSSTRRPQARLGVPHAVILDSDEEDGDYISEEGFVECPICTKSVKEATINGHIDRGCVDPEEPTISKSLPRNSDKLPIKNLTTQPTKPTKRPERLPQINYSMVKDNNLRKKLNDLGISGSGSRQAMEKRYTEWITLWNANCDAKIPRSKGELKRELEAWERVQAGRTYPSSSDVPIKDKDFDGKAWSATHDDSFKKLIANARRKPTPRPKTPHLGSATAEPSGLSTPAAGVVLDSSDPTPANPGRDKSVPPEMEMQKMDISPSKPPGSRGRFFEEPRQDPLELPPSSQLSNGLA